MWWVGNAAIVVFPVQPHDATVFSRTFPLTATDIPSRKHHSAPKLTECHNKVYAECCTLHTLLATKHYSPLHDICSGTTTHASQHRMKHSVAGGANCASSAKQGYGFGGASACEMQQRPTLSMTMSTMNRVGAQQQQYSLILTGRSDDKTGEQVDEMCRSF